MYLAGEVICDCTSSLRFKSLNKCWFSISKQYAHKK